MKNLIETEGNLIPGDREILKLLIGILKSPWPEGIKTIKDLEEKL